MVLQALVNGLVEASVIVLAAMGLSLIYGVKKFPNFAHGDVMTIGAYFALWTSSTFQAGIVVGLIASVVFLAILSMLFEFAIFSRLEGRGPVASLIASVGLALVLPRSAGVDLGVYDVTGRLVRHLMSGAAPRGRSELHWDLTDRHGAPVPAGIYFARLVVGGAPQAERKIVAIP